MTYRLKKLARRRRGAVMATSLVTTAFVAGLVMSGPLYVRYAASRQKSARDTQWRAYVANVTEAKIRLDALDPVAALRALNQTAPDLRGWEWRHLYLRADPSLATLKAYGPRQTSSGPSFLALRDRRRAAAAC